MSISLNANFELLSAGLYLDARQQFNTIIEMKDFAETSVPDGFITYNKETQKHYVFSSSNTVDATLGKWREYDSGDSSSTYPTWDSNVDYKVGNVVLKDEVRYSCIADHTSTDFETDSINWVVVLEQYYHVTQEQYNKMVSDGLITDGTKDLYIIDGNSEGGNSFSASYTSLSELGLTADATVEDVVNALKNGESFLAPVNTFTNYETIFPNKVPNDQWNKIHITKGTSLASSHIICFSPSGTSEYLANINGTNIVGWIDVSGTYIDISDAIIEKLGNEILKYPVGKYRINSTTTGNKFTDLPSDAEMKCGLIEINGTSVGKSPFTDAWVYRMYKFECLTGTLSYVRRLNSGATVGQIEVDSGWQIENPPAQQVYTSTPIGTVLSFAGLTPPNGYLLCDGATYAVADYQDLYDVIGNTYGGSDGTFNVPNLCDGRFLEGSDTSGEYVEAGLPNIEGKWDSDYQYSPYFEGTFEGAFSRETISGTKKYGSNGGTGARVFKFDASLSNPIYGNSDTVQPKSLRVLYIIKAFHTNEGVDAPVELTDTVINHITNKVAEIERESELFQYENRVITLETQVNELFQSVSDGKTLVANAITDKGVSTSTSATFATMASNIRNLNNGIGYTSESKNGSVRVERGGTGSISITFSNTVLGVTGVSYSWSDAHLGYRGFSVSGNTVTVKIELGDTYANSSRTISCTVSANIRT